MGHSQKEKSDSHERIVAAAADRIREHGTEAPSVAEIMGDAGLTHGGFYKHFGSREELIAAAAEAVMEASTEATREAVAGAEDPLAAFVDWYASPTHRDSRTEVCGVAALGADVARGGEDLRATYGAQVERYAETMAGLTGAEDRAEALAKVSTLVGALYLARALGDTKLSDEILAAARASVKDRA
jgi:TetR/AcrR family transcriptional regulator, transcriptional repressor for nem operon